MAHDHLCQHRNSKAISWHLCAECAFIKEIRADEQARQREEMTALLLEARSHP